MTITQRVEELERKVAELSKPIDRPKAILQLGPCEFRWSDTNNGYEIVEWDTQHKYCWVVAFFDKTSEGYDMRTVGVRFHEAGKDAYELAELAFEWLDELEGRGNDVDYT
jgi:hypothetical protein